MGRRSVRKRSSRAAGAAPAWNLSAGAARERRRGLLPFLLFGELRLLRALARSSSIAAAISGLSSPLYQTRSSSPGAIGCGERRDRRRANQSGGCWWGGGREGREPEASRAGRAPKPAAAAGGGCGKEPSAGGRTSLPARFLSMVHKAIYGSRECFKLKTAICCESYCSKPYRWEKRNARNHFAHEI